MQAQARSASADVRTAKRLYSDFLESHPDVFVPPGMSCHMTLYRSYVITRRILFRDCSKVI